MPQRRLRASLLIAGAGAVLVLIDVGGLVAELVGVGLIALGLALAAPDRYGPRGEAPGWWRLLAAGAVLAGAGVALGQLLETPGGLLAAVGGALVVIAAALGLP